MLGKNSLLVLILWMSKKKNWTGMINKRFQTFVCNYKTTYKQLITPRKVISEWLSNFCRCERDKRGRESRK